MGLVHIPRVIATLAQGYMRARMRAPHTAGLFKGLSLDDPHVFTARAGLFDIDYLGHLNNAAYLTHAELARWHWAASSGLLESFIRESAAFISASTIVRYRREISPLFRKFEVRTSVVALDESNVWIYQTFNYPDQTKIRAQALLKQAILQKGKKLDPREFLLDKFGVPAEIIDDLDRTGKDPLLHEEIIRYEDMETALRAVAVKDDERLFAAQQK